VARRKFKVHFRIPPYVTPRNRWRRRIYAEALSKLEEQGVTYLADDRLEITIVLYLTAIGLKFQDIDNRVKDVLDALQARMGGSKKKRLVKPLIPNDSQIFKLAVRKSLPPKQSHALGHVTISRYMVSE
jgi:Holliday junction resolvase RusA-like endonuclease